MNHCEQPRRGIKLKWAILLILLLTFREQIEIVLGLYDIFTQDEGQPETYFVFEITMVSKYQDYILFINSFDHFYQQK